MKKFALLFVPFILAPPPLWAGGTEGATPFNFLFLDANARPVALGGAYAALATDANALLYNPAGLANIAHHEITFMHTEHFQGVTQEYGALAIKGDPLGLPGSGFGLMVNTLGFGDIRRTTLSNPRGTGLGDFGIRDWALSFGYAQRFWQDRISLGIAAKYIREEIDDITAQTGAADIGVLTNLEAYGFPVSLGLSIQNLGAMVKFQSKKEDLPLNVTLGAAYRVLEQGLFLLDLNQPKDGDITVHAGAEYTFLKTAALRLGYNGRNDADTGITAGGGVLLERFSLDYAFVPFGDLGDSHRISLSYRW
ncbi:MAG: PorV/PorQ family protein [Elusimicrobia bacterium]|nr:PorV/PorQ family protein [Elusimicrobiota bacterium]